MLSSLLSRPAALLTPLFRRHVLAVGYRQTGKPEQVLTHLQDGPTTGTSDVAVAEGFVGVELLYAPINPSDINMAEGVYPIRRPLPSIGGNEGVGRVVLLPASSSKKVPGQSTPPLQIGDLVWPASPAFGGTWRRFAVVPTDQVERVPAGLQPLQAAAMSINPCSAYRMLRDYLLLAPGDVVVQNGATSAVGLAVIEMARAAGVKTVNIVRRRETPAEQAALSASLTQRGADLVLADSELGSAETAEKIKALGRGELPRLALNCVGGQSATDMVRLLRRGGVMVTYGGMSKRPVTVSTGALIFNDVTLRGFWLSEWIRTRPRNDVEAMHEAVAELVVKGHVTTNHRIVPLSMDPVKMFNELYNSPTRSMTKLVYDCQK